MDTSNGQTWRLVGNAKTPERWVELKRETETGTTHTGIGSGVTTEQEDQTTIEALVIMSREMVKLSRAVTELKSKIELTAQPTPATDSSDKHLVERLRMEHMSLAKERDAAYQEIHELERKLKEAEEKLKNQEDAAATPTGAAH
jgi:seryl-tRNA synthetase